MSLSCSGVSSLARALQRACHRCIIRLSTETWFWLGLVSCWAKPAAKLVEEGTLKGTATITPITHSIPPLRQSAKNRQHKIDAILKESHYIGHPLYLETKLSYILYPALVAAYDERAGKLPTLEALYSKLDSLRQYPHMG